MREAELSQSIRRTLALLEENDRREAYMDDPILWARERLGVYIWSNPDNPDRSQAAVMRSVAENKNTAVKAAHGTSKSFSAATLILWWLDTRYPRAFVATTAPSTAQIGGIVWRELRRMLKHMRQRYEQGLLEYPPPPGKITANNVWKDDDGTILGWGRKPPDEDLDSAFQGIHDVYVLAIGDEATGLSEDMVDALANITSNATSRRLLLCNPTDPSSYIGRVFQEDTGAWNLITISVFDNPNFTREEVPLEVRAALSDQVYVDDKKREYGEDSPRYKSRVLGEFAYDSENVLFGDREIATGLDTEIEPTEDPPVLGVDVARYGGDKSTIYVNDNGRLRFHSAWDKASGIETSNRIHRAALETGAREVRIDGIGLGGPIVDLVANMSEGAYGVREVRGSAASPDRRKWYNWRAWSHDAVRDLMASGGLDLDPDDRVVIDQLTGIRYSFPGAGGMLIEGKEDMRKRGLKSPDHSDAFIYAALTDTHISASSRDQGASEVVILDDLDIFSEEERLWDSV